MSPIKHVTSDTFANEVLESAKPVVVDFYATWCGPCRMIASMLEQMAQELAEDVEFRKVNIDDAHALAGSYQVSDVPTLLLVSGGQVVDRLVGAVPVNELRKRIASLLNAPVSSAP